MSRCKSELSAKEWLALIAFVCLVLIVLTGRKRTRIDGYTQRQTETQRRAAEGRALKQAADNIKKGLK